MNRSIRRRAARYGLVGTTVLSVGMSAAIVPAHADRDNEGMGFTPITTGALACSTTGDPAWAPGLEGMALMSKGDPATKVSDGSATVVGSENDMIALSNNGKYLYSVSEDGVSSGVSRYTLKGKDAGKKEILATGPTNPTWSRIDGAYWYGPSNVLLVGEEYGPGAATANTQARGGGVWQVDGETGAYVRLDWLGSMAHEGIVFAGGALWFGDENRTGAMFKAVPTNAKDLTKGGKLYYLVGSGIDASGYKLVVNPDKAVSEAIIGGAILFDRPEDVDARNGRVYFTATEPQADSDTRKGNYNGTPAGGAAATNQVVNRGGIYSFNATGFPELATQSGALPPYAKIAPMIEVQDPKYPNVAAAKAQQGLQFPDNIAFDGQGNLWVHEDIPDGSSFPASGIDVSKQVRDQQDELWVFELDRSGASIVPADSPSKGYKAADMRSSDPAAPCSNEFSGGVFSKNGKTLYINQQHNQNTTFAVELGRGDDDHGGEGHDD